MPNQPASTTSSVEDYVKAALPTSRYKTKPQLLPTPCPERKRGTPKSMLIVIPVKIHTKTTPKAQSSHDRVRFFVFTSQALLTNRIREGAPPRHAKGHPQHRMAVQT